MELAPVARGAKKNFRYRSDEAIAVPPLLSAGSDNPGSVNSGPDSRPLRSRSPDDPRFYRRGSPILEAKNQSPASRFTFGTADCLHSGGGTVARQLSQPADVLSTARSPLLSQKSQEENHVPSNSVSKTVVPFGRSRRMSKSLPELRDLQFVSVLPDVEEEESDQSELEQEVVCEKPTRVPWHRKLDFLWCSVCHALGFANIWRFPYYCYSNGGGSFLLPYLVFMIICGVPFLSMELAIGQMTQSGPISAFGQLCPLMKGIGVASMMISFWLTAYYSVLTSWTLFYTFNSFYSPPRWTRCTNTWNSESCRDLTADENADSQAASTLSTASVAVEGGLDMLLTSPAPEASDLFSNASSNGPLSNYEMNMTHPAVEFLNIKMLDRTDGIDDSGELRFELLASVLFVWILTYIALRKTDFFRGTAIYVLTVVSYLILFSIFLRTVALEGGKTGLQHLFKPDWHKMSNPRVLLYALAQAFHSLGVVLGPSILMGSCHKQHNNLLRDTLVLTAATLFTVLIIGCITFATVGHLALKMNKPFWTVISDDPGTVFVLYSVVIGSMPLPSCWAVFFFLALLFLGLDSEIKLMATLVSALKEAYTYYIKQRFQGHSMFLAVICGFCFAACMPYLTQAGIFFFQLIDHHIAVVATTVVALFEVCTLGLLYGTANLSSCIQQMTGKTPSYFYRFCWMILSPITILSTLIYWCVRMGEVFIKRDYAYPHWALITGWVLFALTVCWIPVLAMAAYRKAVGGGDFLNKLKSCVQPRLRNASQSRWEPKPVIILNGSTVTASEFPDYNVPDLPILPNAVQSYVERHSGIHRNDETSF